MDSIYINIFIKMAAAFIILIIYIHLSGKGSLAPISALDQVGNIVLGAIIGGPLYNPSITVYLLVSAAGAWAGLLLLVRYVTFKRSEAKNLVDGRPIRLIEDGKILSENFASAKISIRDFIMLLHQRGYTNLNDIENVWYEYNGQLTVVKKGEQEMAIALIENSNINTENLESLNFTEQWLKSEIAKQHSKLDDIFLAEWHENKLWIYSYQKEKES
ncbi:DUF421 domain-containing protein [Orbus wheelerorum]|uniref:DUF421 domain-containing protein n=1 Tax=Orbus wheelerorum TaxID=3074111 RepID=UPI00370D3D96